VIVFILADYEKTSDLLGNRYCFFVAGGRDAVERARDEVEDLSSDCVSSSDLCEDAVQSGDGGLCLNGHGRKLEALWG